MISLPENQHKKREIKVAQCKIRMNGIIML